ncbi:MAG: four helix bundle protein [Candidatus Omnitrophota bacterium]
MTNDKIQMTNQSINPNSKYDIKERSLEFAARTALFVRCIPKDIISSEYCKQLIRSSASIGANTEEADGTLSKKDFVNKIAIARREARESRYWLNLIRKTNFIEGDILKMENEYLINESKELLLILSSIIRKTKF